MTLTKSDLLSIGELIDTKLDKQKQEILSEIDIKLEKLHTDTNTEMDVKLAKLRTNINTDVGSTIHDGLLAYDSEQDRRLDNHESRIEKLERETGISSTL